MRAYLSPFAVEHMKPPQLLLNPSQFLADLPEQFPPLAAELPIFYSLATYVNALAIFSKGYSLLPLQFQSKRYQLVFARP